MSTINDIIDDVFPNIYTSLTKKELMSLAKDMFDYNLGDTIGFPMAYAPVTTDADRKSTRLNSSHMPKSRMPSSA